MDVMDPTMLSQPAAPGMGTPLGFGKFFRFFVAFMIASSVGGEMAYDGDFSRAENAPAAVARGCVKTFRAYPFKMSFTATVSPLAAAFEGMDANRAVSQLREEGFVPADATALYAGKMVYNDRMIFAARDASRLWPEVLRADSCEIGLFLRNNRVTGAFARAVRRDLTPRVEVPFQS